MKYIANPVEVEAYKITKIAKVWPGGDMDVILDNGVQERVTLPMTARMSPKEGDYWVVQPDGYVYLNPKDVFERKYRPAQDCPLVGCKIVGPHEHAIEGPVTPRSAVGS